MARKMMVASGQLGPIQRAESRASAVGRLLDLMKQAAARDCRFIVFPELALTTFFPRWYMEDQAEVDAYFESAMPNPDVQPLFDAAKDFAMGFNLGYAELSAANPAQVPIARPRTDFGNDALIIARLPGTSIAPPTPCRPRATMSVVASGANAHAAEATANTATPATKTRRRPYRSPADPPTNSNAPSSKP